MSGKNSYDRSTGPLVKSRKRAHMRVCVCMCMSARICVRVHDVHVCMYNVCVHFGYIGSGDRLAGRLGGGVVARRARSARATGSRFRCTDEKKINTVYMTVCVLMQCKYNQLANIIIIIIKTIRIGLLSGRACTGVCVCVCVPM